MFLLSIIKTENVKMNQNEEVPDFLGGHGDLLPADVLKMVNELLEQLHQADSNHQGSIVLNSGRSGKRTRRKPSITRQPLESLSMATHRCLPCFARTTMTS